MTAGAAVPEGGRPRAWPVLALAALAVALRLWHLDHGLPWFEEEALPFRKSFELWGWDGTGHHWNPDYFHYPSLTLYLQHLIQGLHYLFGRATGAFASPADYYLAFHTDPTVHVVVARLLGVAADAATVVAAYVLGEKWRRGLGLVAGFAVAVAPAVVFHGRAIFTDTVMTALVMWSVVAAVRWHGSGARRHLILAAVLAGLAAGAKYPGALALVPLAMLALLREGPRRAALTIPVAAALAGLVFLITTPFALLDTAAFLRDFGFEREHMTAGHLGRTGGPVLVSLLALLGRNLGWLLLPAGLLGAMAALASFKHPDRDVTGLALTAVALPFLAMFGSFTMFADRYAVVLVPPLALLGCALGARLLERVPASARNAATGLAVLAALAWPTFTGLQIAASGGLTTRQQAGDWLAAEVGPDHFILTEEYGPNLLTHRHFNMPDARQMEAASIERQEAFGNRVYHRAITIPMLVSGSVGIFHRNPAGGGREIPLWPDAWDFNAVYYDRQYFLAADFVVLSSAMSDRYREDHARFPIQNALYDWLAAEVPVAAEFAPSGRVSGPVITIHDLRGLELPLPGFGPLVWIGHMPDPARRAVMAAAKPSGVELRPEHLCAFLASPFARYLKGWYMQTAFYLSDLDRHRASLPYLRAALAFEPDHALAAVMAASALSATGRNDEAAATLESCLAARGDAADPPTRQLQGMLRQLRSAASTEPSGN
ncbi:MAG: phospholipid carrier-dependent glycosyltransferase [bacterium]|nr:phospholipid carrier-dependent glycosyltransferase [bacterium]